MSAAATCSIPDAGDSVRPRIRVEQPTCQVGRVLVVLGHRMGGAMAVLPGAGHGVPLEEAGRDAHVVAALVRRLHAPTS